MNSVAVCVVLLISVTIIIIYMYYLQENHHKYQLAKIKSLEYKYEVKNKELMTLSLQSQKCNVPNLNDPRSCYFGSNYNCTWNDLIGRCDIMS